MPTPPGTRAGRAGLYGFLVGLSAVSPTVAREVLGAGYAGGMVLTQVAPGPRRPRCAWSRITWPA
ncbi:hypothetical protein ACTMU2_00500 [Cupriavidus basilensis]